jgi:hypothetical protein
MFPRQKKILFCSCLLVLAYAPTALGQKTSKPIRQPKQVVEAYRVCERFQTLLAENLDFDRAYEATFTKSVSRRREIAIVEGEFGGADLASVDDATLIDAFKSRMQILYLMLPLASPETEPVEAVFFPPKIKAIFERKPPEAVAQFRAFALQLKQDASDFRAHLNQLAQRYPSVAERLRKFKTDLTRKSPIPGHVVKPLTAYSRGRVLGLKEQYYQIGDYAVIREGNEMRIIGIRFFSRLF